MALLKRLVVGGLRVYKPKIQATKPKDTGKMVADGVVVSLPSAVLSVESAQNTCTKVWWRCRRMCCNRTRPEVGQHDNEAGTDSTMSRGGDYVTKT